MRKHANRNPCWAPDAKFCSNMRTVVEPAIQGVTVTSAISWFQRKTAIRGICLLRRKFLNISLVFDDKQVKGMRNNPVLNTEVF